MNVSITDIMVDDDITKFTIKNTNVSVVNALRRIILTDIPACVIQTDSEAVNQCKIEINTGRLHNEFLKQRLSCIPIHIDYDDINILPEKYELVLDAENTSDSLLIVTSGDFKIRNFETGKFCTEEQTKRIFPPNKLTNQYIDFARLRAKLSESFLGEKLKLTARFSVSTAGVNSSFNMVSKCTFMNTVDVDRVNDRWDEVEKEKKALGMSPETIEFDKKNFYILDAQRLFKKDCFDFTIQTVGVYDNEKILKIACDVIIARCKKIENLVETDQLLILQGETTIQNCYDIVLDDEDYTIGKLYEFMLYDTYFIKDPILSFCGFNKPHPHDTSCIVRIAYNFPVEKSTIRMHVKEASDALIKIFEDIQKSF
jgi:DNA-directed RNA polymerase subunit L